VSFLSENGYFSGGIAMADHFELPALTGMTREELLEALESVQALLCQLDEQEPEDMDSEEYEAWGDRHEELEDRQDEIWDLLDE
jgi:hypothetical protein